MSGLSRSVSLGRAAERRFGRLPPSGRGSIDEGLRDSLSTAVAGAGKGRKRPPNRPSVHRLSPAVDYCVEFQKTLQFARFFSYREGLRRLLDAAMLAPSGRADEGAQASVEHQIELTADGLWSEVSERLRGALNEATFGTWFGDAAGSELSDDAFTLAVPNDFTREWIEGHFLGLIRAAVKDATGHERRIHLTVRDDMVRSEPISDGMPLEQPV